jgi:hypothetical protein
MVTKTLSVKDSMDPSITPMGAKFIVNESCEYSFPDKKIIRAMNI